jgi:hypothetical protein
MTCGPGVKRVAALGAAVLVLGGCSSDVGPSPTERVTTSASPPSDSSSGTSIEPAPATGVIDVAGLSAGSPPELTHLADGELHWRGRTVPTDLPDDIYYPSILGAASGRLVLTAYQTRGEEPSTRFWAVDRTGHAERLGRGYDAEQYLPALVGTTGHLFVWNADRTTPWTIREVDARTGRELATYDEDRLPQGLAPDDQARADAWLKGKRLEDYRQDRTRDGSLSARARSLVAGTGAVVTRVDVVRTADDSRLARFSFDTTTEDSSFDGVRFEDRDHVLVLLTLASSRRGGDQQVVVRCAVDSGTCERATPVGGAIALGVHRPVLVHAEP